MYQGSTASGVCYAGLQFMQHGTSKLPSCLGLLGRAVLGSEPGADVARLGGVHCVGLWHTPLSAGDSPATGDYWAGFSPTPP